LFNAEPHSSVEQPPGTLAIESISGDHYVSLQEYPSMVRRGVDSSHDYYNAMGSRSMYNQSSVATGIVTPYGSPNNNPRYLTRAEKHFDLPMRYPDHAYDIFKGTGEKVARPITAGGAGTFHGGAPTDAQSFDDMIEATNAGVVIDLRTSGDPREVDSIAQEREWAQSNPRDIQSKNIPLATTLPESGTKEYDKFLGQLHEFEQTLQTARAEGKNVFYHCRWGQDRTGIAQAFDQVMNQNVPIDQALANWKALKSTYDQGFIDLYSEPRFRQMIEDYRAQYPSD
jgi:Tyrosine phosphatase family